MYDLTSFMWWKNKTNATLEATKNGEDFWQQLPEVRNPWIEQAKMFDIAKNSKLF